ncbi:RES family NAD+ phosphorylase [Aquirufa sp. TARAVU-A1A]
MKVYRIEREKYLGLTLSGEGAAKSMGFRWNSVNTYVVYASESRSLAMLEVSVHLDLREDLPLDRYFVEIEIPDEIKIMELSVKDLPNSWDAKPPRLETQFIGDDFIDSHAAAVLKVPSCIISAEFNYLINPHHLDSKAIRVVSTEALQFDRRFREEGNV